MQDGPGLDAGWREGGGCSREGAQGREGLLHAKQHQGLPLLLVDCGRPTRGLGVRLARP